MSAAPHLLETRRAFDSVAAFYDGPLGNNEVVQRMRAALLDEVARRVRPGARLLDLGCGTGIDAAHFAARGYRVVAVDSSAGMVARARARAQGEGITGTMTVRALDLADLGELAGERFDAIYSDLGALNCAPDLAATAAACAALLPPGGALVASVIGRVCPWELAYFLLRGDPGRARVRFARGAVPVGLNGGTVWTRYYRPREFAAAFAPFFDRVGVRALRLFAPPPYLTGLQRRLGPAARALEWLDRRAGSAPLLRGAGDHFLMVLDRHE